MEPRDEGLRRRVGLLAFIVVLVIVTGLVAWLVTRDGDPATLQITNVTATA